MTDFLTTDGQAIFLITTNLQVHCNEKTSKLFLFQTTFKSIRDLLPSKNYKGSALLSEKYTLNVTHFTMLVELSNRIL